MRRARVWVPLVGTVLCAEASLARADPPSWLARDVVAEVTRRALTHAGLDPGPLEGLSQRARRSAWMPRVSLRVGRNLGASLTQSTAGNGTERLSADESLLLDVRVEFDLDHAVFHPSEVSLERAVQQRTERRLALENTVVELLARMETLRLGPAAGGDTADAVRARVEALRARARVEQLMGQRLEAVFPPAMPPAMPQRP